MRTWEVYEKERFGYISGECQNGFRLVKTLEDFLNVHPFPKYQHTARFIYNESK